jgi:hypothetical protein
MQSFFATIETDVGTYYIDLKPNKHSHQWAVMHSTGASYLCSLQEALDWIESHSEYILSTAV